MTCDQTAPLLARAADGTLDAQRLALLAGHLEACPDCRAALETQRAARAAVAARPDRPVSHGFTARVMAALPEREPAAAALGWLDALNWRAWTLRLAPVAAALFVAAALGAGPSAEASGDEAVDFTELAAAWAADDGGGEAGQASDPPMEAVTALWQDESELTDDVLIELLAASAP
ncbi:MAG: zf-HC2 domain-containing protein [Acidobacteria bacterium]|nr:zf-HC2 domain-containing protein [Acidobacteriota bacterium]